MPDKDKIRLDVLTSVYFFYPIKKLTFQKKKQRVSILMYHSISEDDQSDKGMGYYHTNTKPSIFADHMQFLHDHNYNIVDLDSAIRHIQEEADGDNRTVVITFDDGYRDLLTSACPIINRYGYSATVFLPTQYINERGSKFKGRRCLNWSEIRELKRGGVLVGSHTETHSQLHNLSPSNIHFELERSKRCIEDKISEPVNSFSYPYAFPEHDRHFTRELRSILVSCGYKNGVTTIVGTTRPIHDRFFLRRLPVNSLDTLRLFQMKLEGGYDWLHFFQLQFKKVHEVVSKGKKP